MVGETVITEAGAIIVMMAGVTIAAGTAAGIMTVADGKPGITTGGLDSAAIPTIAGSFPDT